MITIRVHKYLAVAFMIVAVLALGAGWAAASGSDEVYHACANTSSNGALHVVAADEPCASNEVRFAWNSQGPQGPQGLPGKEGAPGADGTHCWDVNGNGVGDPRPEDRNGDRVVDALDCQVPDSVWQNDLAAESAARAAADADLDARLAQLEDLLTHFSRQDSAIFITGANLYVTNGMGVTESTNGLGNVIIGYNELRDLDYLTNERSGSHMLVVGKEHNYSSYGGIVVGQRNSTTGTFASISGGSMNRAEGDYSSVSGGIYSNASGMYSSVSGGYNNDASGAYSSVSGGNYSVAGGDYSSVSGGTSSVAGGDYSSVSGGYNSVAGGDYSSVSGGKDNNASGAYSSVSGGGTGEASGSISSVSGGYYNVAGGDYSSVSGAAWYEANETYSYGP